MDIRKAIENNLGDFILYELKDNRAKIGFYSEMGEDFDFIIAFDGTWKDYCNKCNQFATNFNQSRHAKKWIRKVDEISMIEDLIDDAIDIKYRLVEFANKLDKNVLTY